MSKHILAIDDEENLLKIYQIMLESSGYRIDTALDGQEGLKKIRELHPDLVLLDIQLPKQNGYEVLAEIKNDPAIQHIPVILLSASSTKPTIDAGAAAHITKPFDAQALIKTIERLC